MIEQAIRYILVNDATVKAITTRCYPVMIPQGATMPLIRYQKVSGVRDHVLTGPTGLARPRIQVEAWAETYSGAKSLAAAIREALDGYIGTAASVAIGSCLIESERDIYESELGVHRVVQDYMIYHKEN